MCVHTHITTSERIAASYGKPTMANWHISNWHMANQLWWTGIWQNNVISSLLNFFTLTTPFSPKGYTKIKWLQIGVAPCITFWKGSVALRLILIAILFWYTTCANKSMTFKRYFLFLSSRLLLKPPTQHHLWPQTLKWSTSVEWCLHQHCWGLILTTLYTTHWSPQRWSQF